MSDSPKKGSTFISFGRDAARKAGVRFLEGVKGAIESSALVKEPDRAVQPEGPEPPVVARLMIEIRSDGSRTIARGALEDTTTNQTAAIRAEGTTPAQLARSLAGTLMTLPLFAARVARSLKKPEGE